MTGKRGYNAYFESWTPSLMEDGTEENNLNELFVQETLDPRIESVMPILNRIHKKVSESVVDKEVNKLAEWADSLVEEESIKSNNPVGIPEGLDQYSPVTQAITRRILSQHPDLLQKHGPEKVANAIDDVAEFVGDVEEIGSSDVSGWVKQVTQSLGGIAEGKGDFSQAIEQLSGWDEVSPDEPGTRQYDFDDDEGGYYAQGTVVQDLKTGQIKIEFKDDGEYGGHEINDTFNSIGDAMNALRNITTRRSKSGKAQNFDTLGARELTGPDDVYKTDKIGKKGTLKKIRTDIMKASSPYRMRGGPKGVLPEEVDLGQYDAVKPISNSGTTPEQEKEFRKKVQAYGKELDQRQKEKEKGVTEGSHEEQVAKLAAYNEKMAGENPPIDLGLREIGNWAKVGHYGDPIKTAWFNIAKYGIRNNKFNDSVDKAMSAIGDFPDKYDLSIPEIDTLYSAYETVYDQWEQSRGAANENFINQADQAVVSEEDEMAEGVLDSIKKGVQTGVQGVKKFGQDAKAAGKEAWDEVVPMLKQDWKNPIQAAMAKEGEMDEGEHTQHAMRGRNPGANEFEHDFEPEDKVGNIHDKISKMLKKLSKSDHNPKMKDTDSGSTTLDETTEPWETDDEAAEREKKESKSKDSKGSDGSEHGGHSRAKHLAKQAIPKDEVKEGQEDLDAILRIIRK